MNSVWTTKWKKILIWAVGYLNIIAFALVGGYVIVKKEEELQETTKKVFVITLIFTALSAFFSIFNSVGSMFDGYYSSIAYDIYSYASSIISIGKIITYAMFIIKELVDKQEN